MRATEFGATAAIDASKEDVKAAAQRIAGNSLKVIFDCVGVPGSLQVAMEYADIDARVVVVGLCMAPDTFLPARAIVKELDLIFAFVYRRQDFELALNALRHERIKVDGMVTRSVGFDAFPTTFEALKKPGRDIKVMLEP